MAKRPSDRLQSVPSNLYDQTYFLSECEGYTQFGGGQLSPRLLEAVRRVKLGPGMRALDVGCGRGEIVHASWQQGVAAYGIDYAAAAVEIAQSFLTKEGVQDRAAIVRANAKQLPFADEAFHAAFMLDIVEHLHPHELAQAFGEVCRVLRADGVLFVHTAPNLWYYRFGYPVYRLMRRLQGQILPLDPKDRFPSHHAVHVNEQSVVSLQRALGAAGLMSQIWVDQSQDRFGSSERPWVRGLAHWVTHDPLLKWIFCGDIFAIAWKAP